MLATTLVLLLLWPSAGARGPWTLWLAAALALLPLAAAPLGPEFVEVLLGKERAVEAVTEGLLLAAIARALLERRWLLAAVAILFFGEEVDWGQLWFHFDTPEAVAWYPSRVSSFNFHNVGWSDPLWRLLPLASLAAMSWPGIARRLGLPPGPARTWLAVIALVAGTLVANLVVDGRVADEAMELAAVALVCAAWRAGHEPRVT